MGKKEKSAPPTAPAGIAQSYQYPPPPPLPQLHQKKQEHPSRGITPPAHPRGARALMLSAPCASAPGWSLRPPGPSARQPVR